MKRCLLTGRLEPGVKVGSFVKRSRIDVLDRVQFGTGLIICGDAIEIRLHQLGAGQRTRPHCGVYAIDGRLDDVERAGGLCGHHRLRKLL
jgi:hypothetical protein